jgi:uncharacterized protein
MSSITGRGWAFPPRISDRDQVTMVQDDAEIKQSIYIILNTFPGERVMRPEFGCEIHSLIFWPANEQTAAIAERYVTDALHRWEPRIRLQSVNAKPGDYNLGELLIDVVYQIKDQHDTRSLVYPFYLTPA